MPKCITKDLLFDKFIIIYFALRKTVVTVELSTFEDKFFWIGYLNLLIYFLNRKILCLLILLFIPFTTVWTSGSSGIYYIYTFLVYKILNK